MRCMDCKEFWPKPEQEAEWILIGDFGMKYQVRILCDSHLQQYREYEGDMNLNYKRLDAGVWFEVIEELNKTFEYLDEMYSRLLKEHSALKKVQSSEGTAK